MAPDSLLPALPVLPVSRMSASATAAKTAGLCGVCAAAPHKYKCPACRTPYCSVVCFKAHKQDQDACVRPQDPSNTSAASSRQPKPDGNNDDDDDDDVVIKPPDSVLVKDDDPVLTHSQLERLRSSDVIASMVAQPALQSLLLKIDSSPYPEQLLDKHLSRDKSLFRAFADEALRVTKDADGQQGGKP